MNIFKRFKRLTYWNKIGTIGAIASIIGVIVTLLLIFRPKLVTDNVKLENQKIDITTNDINIYYIESEERTQNIINNNSMTNKSNCDSLVKSLNNLKQKYFKIKDRTAKKIIKSEIKLLENTIKENCK